MTIPQTSYSQSMDAGFAGLVADVEKASIRGYRNDESGAIPLGVMVMVNSAKDDGAKLPASSGALMLGITAHSHARNPTGLSTPSYAAGAMMNVVRKGRVWVL